MQNDSTQNHIKVAVMTYLYADNYGSVLQAYALNQTLTKMGYDAFLVDYRKKEVVELYRIFKPNRSRYNILTNCYHFCHFFELRRKQEKFQEFRNRYLPVSEDHYETFESLSEQPPTADVFICGSDQVWNTGIVDFDTHYLLDFVKRGKKISYAASGITKDTPDDQIQYILGHIQTFQSVSVREVIAKNKLEHAGTLRVACVVDPVLLLSAEEWRQLSPPNQVKSPYMFCYFSGGVSRAFEQYTKSLAELLGLKRVIIMPEWRNAFNDSTKRYDCGPLDFLGYLQSASIVCTNSFHGTVFSTIFNRPFVVGLHKPSAEERISTFLSMCGLTSREIDPQDACPNSGVLKIDFTQANAAINISTENSRKWILSAIEGGEH